MKVDVSVEGLDEMLRGAAVARLQDHINQEIARRLQRRHDLNPRTEAFIDRRPIRVSASGRRRNRRPS